MAYDQARLEQALINADKAGDTEAAATFATEIRKMRGITQELAKPSNPTLGEFVFGDATAGEYAKGRINAAKDVFKPETWKNIGSELANFQPLPDDLSSALREEPKPDSNFDPSGLAMSAMPLTAMSKTAMAFLKPTSNNVNQKLVDAAIREGIPLMRSQVTGSKPAAITESVLENLPATSSKQLALREAQKKAYNAAVLKTAGAKGTDATPDILLATRNKLGAKFEDIAGRNSIDFNKGVTADLANVAHEATRRLSKPDPIVNTIDDILADVGKNGILPGTKYQGWRETLGRMAKGNDSEAHYASEVKKVLDKSFSKQISGADSAAWKEASTQYGNLKVIMQAMGGPGSEQLLGNIPANQLSMAVTRQVGKEGRSLGRGNLSELANIGKSFISNGIQDSGTAQRLFYQRLLTGNLVGAVPGAAVGYYEGGVPGAVAGGLAGAGLAHGAPKLAQMLVNSGMHTGSPTSQKLSKLLMQRGALGTSASAQNNYLANLLNEQRNQNGQ